MEQLSRSEEQVMAALWACSRAATRREIAAQLPPACRWADSTLLNFLLRLEKKKFVRTEKQGNKNLYTPLVRRLTFPAGSSPFTPGRRGAYPAPWCGRWPTPAA